MTRLAQLTTALVVAATAAACGGSSSDNSSIVAPTGTLVTDTFTGTVPVMGSDSHNFTVTTSGVINVTLIAAGPPTTITMGLGIGTPSSTGVCALISGGSTVTTAGTTAQLSGTIAAGGYCVVVVDVGNANVPIAYTVTVAHT